MIVCPSVCLSVTRRYSVKTAKHMLKLFSPWDSHTIQVFSAPNGVTILRKRLPKCGRRKQGVWKKSRFSTNISLYLYTKLYMICRAALFSTTLNDPYSDFKVKLLFDAEYLRNGTRYGHNFNGILFFAIYFIFYFSYRLRWIKLCTNRDLHTSYSRVSFWMTLSYLEWLSEIFNDMKHRAVSLRQLSFLFTEIWH